MDSISWQDFLLPFPQDWVWVAQSLQSARELAWSGVYEWVGEWVPLTLRAVLHSSNLPLVGSHWDSLHFSQVTPATTSASQSRTWESFCHLSLHSGVCDHCRTVYSPSIETQLSTIPSLGPGHLLVSPHSNQSTDPLDVLAPPFFIEPWDMATADILTAVSEETLSQGTLQITDSQTLWDNKCFTFQVAKF